MRRLMTNQSSEMASFCIFFSLRLPSNPRRHQLTNSMKMWSKHSSEERGAGKVKLFHFLFFGEFRDQSSATAGFVLRVLLTDFCHNIVKFLRFHLSKSSLVVVGPGKTPCSFSLLVDPCSSTETGKPNLKLGSSSISAIYSTTKAFQFLPGSFLYEFTADLHVYKCY